MKKAIVLLMISLLLIPSTSIAQPRVDKPFKIRATCYTWTGNRCANGDYPTEGITVAYRKEDIGKTAILYSIKEDDSIGEVIGYFVIQDTGGQYIRSGQRVDVYRDNMDGVNEWISTYGDYVYMQIVDAEG